MAEKQQEGLAGRKRFECADYEKVIREIDDRYETLELSKDSYGDEFIQSKLDLILYVLITKGVVKMHELVGKPSKDGPLEGGLIEKLVKEKKEFSLSRK